ncbi:uncharacterized protein [Rutidosis leptorrhynchoides]|uniref:uncharacterized protein n=1 Tax=Rutidosis leptorrhynchoides TaxID=125765 RepID=UPI003A9A4540
MESPKSVVSPLKSTSTYTDPEKHNLDHFTRNPSFTSKKAESSLGVLEVYIHQARDIQNICIYHKQDVYAKISLTSNPEKSVTTKTINGGGQNPVFNENLCIDVPNVDASLKCEIYMLSRVRNYLQDQLLGFALIPIADVIVENGKVEKEFTLSTDDLFHSPSGFVQLSLHYTGVSPDVIAISPPLPPAKTTSVTDQSELGKLEFPDPKMANENEMMVSEYYEIRSVSLVSSDTDDQTRSENGAYLSSENGTHLSSEKGTHSSSENETQLSSENGAHFGSENPKPNSPPTSVSTNGSQCDSVPAASVESSDSDKDSKYAIRESDLSAEGGSVGNSVDELKVNIEPEQKVVQQDFVDLYMKSMQQFTESLAKMKLPLEIEKDQQTSSGNSSSDQNNTNTPNGTRSRVFYGSRAFF